MIKLKSIPVYLILIAICALFVFPFYWVVVSSLETISGLNLKPPSLYPAVSKTATITLPTQGRIVTLNDETWLKLPISDSKSTWLLQLEKKEDHYDPTELVQQVPVSQIANSKLAHLDLHQPNITFKDVPVEQVQGQERIVLADQIRGSGSSYMERLFVVPYQSSTASLEPGAMQMLVNPPHQRILQFHAEWSNYVKTLRGPEATFGGVSDGFLLFMRNSLFLSFFAVFAQIASSSLVAYGFARLRFKGRNFLFVILLATLMVPGQVTLIPLFYIFRTLHWVNTFLPLMIPQLTAGAFNVFLIRQFLINFPRELDESAAMDGANHWNIFQKIVFPNLGPVLIIVGLFTFVATWQDVLGPLIYLDNPSLRTVTLGLEYFRSPYVDNRPMLLAGAALSIIPVFLVFLVAQKHILAGIATTGLKE